MFLQKIKALFSPANSIAVRLTLFYSITTFILITAVTLFFYWAMTNILYSADQQFLSDEIIIVKNLIENKQPHLAALQQEAINVPSALQRSTYHYYIRILDENNHVMIESPGLNANTWETHNNDYLVKQEWVKSKKMSWLIQVALDITYQQAVIHKYRNYTLIILCLGAILSLLLGYTISQKGLRRLRDLTETAKSISASALHQRIQPGSWPKELSELGESFNQMLERIESSFTRLISLSDDLAHELRTPISNLLGGTEVALSNATTIGEYRTTLESNLEELQRIYRIIENLLFLARTENPQLDLEKTSINLNQEIDVICQYYQAIADERNITVNIQGKATLSGNQVMIRRMVANILSNALKYGHSNSHIIFDIKEETNKIVKVIVQDHGIGIAAEYLPNIFNRFYRIPNQVTEYTPGTGLGLSIVQSIVYLHQGTISIVSEVNKGTIVTICLPK